MTEDINVAIAVLTDRLGRFVDAVELSRADQETRLRAIEHDQIAPSEWNDHEVRLRSVEKAQGRLPAALITSLCANVIFMIWMVMVK